MIHWEICTRHPSNQTKQKSTEYLNGLELSYKSHMAVSWGLIIKVGRGFVGCFSLFSKSDLGGGGGCRTESGPPQQFKIIIVHIIIILVKGIALLFF